MKSYIICVQTLCGKITPAGFGSPEDRRHLEKWRQRTDATLLGASSLRQGDPQFKDSSGSVPENRIRAIITMSGDLPPSKSIFRFGPRPFVFCPYDVAPHVEDRLCNRARIFPVDILEPGQLDLSQVCRILRAQGARSLLIEGGGRLNHSALEQNVVDELVVTVAPKLSGSSREVSLVHGDTAIGNPFLEMKLVSCRVSVETGELFLHYRLDRRRRKKTIW